MISATNGNIIQIKTYDGNGFLTGTSATFKQKNGKLKKLYSYSLVRDIAGRITEKNEFVLGSNNAYRYTYDLAGRLIGVQKNGNSYSTYNYDSNGNRISGIQGGVEFHAKYDEQDRLVSYNANLYSYNQNGDAASVNYSTGTSQIYRYNALSMLTAVRSPRGDLIEYDFDALLNRAVKKINGKIQAQYIFENPNRIAGRITKEGELLQSYGYAMDSNAPDFFVKNEKELVIIKDYLGSPRLVVDSSSGEIRQEMLHDEFGRIIKDTNPGFQDFGFAGGLYDTDTKLIKFGAREYDPEAGRWLSKDPIGFSGGDPNLFGYVENDPVNWIDPSGTDKFDDLSERTSERNDEALRKIEREPNPLLKAKIAAECAKENIKDGVKTLVDVILHGPGV